MNFASLFSVVCCLSCALASLKGRVLLSFSVGTEAVVPRLTLCLRLWFRGTR